MSNININVGRLGECNVQLRNRSISRKHLRISSTENSEEFLIEDLGSTQGTYVQTPKGWTRIQKSRVNKYARLRLGGDKHAVETTPAALLHAYEEQNRNRIAQPGLPPAPIPGHSPVPAPPAQSEPSSPSGIRRNPDTGEIIYG